MKFTMELAVEPGDAKNLLTICDPRKSAKHQIYAAVQVALTDEAMTWMVCQDMRHMLWLRFGTGLPLQRPADITIHDGTPFLKAVMETKGEPFTLTIDHDVARIGEQVFLASPTQARNSFRTMRNKVHDIIEAAPDADWSTIAFQGTDAKLIGSLVSSKGKATTIAIECVGHCVATPITITESNVAGFTCLNHHQTEWNPTND